MNSLKNTIVAVGLLGLSFAFYQFSEKKPTLNNELISPVAQTEAENNAVEPNSVAPTSALPPSATSPSGIMAPSQPSLTIETPDNSFSGGAAPKQSSTNQFAAPDFTAPKLQPETAPLNPRSEVKPLTLQPRVTPKTTPLQPVETDTAQFGSNSFSASTTEPSTANPQQRDAGLIDALEGNRANSNRLEAVPQKSSDQFVQTPFSGDNSFNRKAGGTSDLSENSLAPLDEATPESKAPESPNYDQLTFREAWPVVEDLVSREQFQDALKLLTRFYQQENLTGPQKQRLEGWLDALAGKVIFSMEHHLQPAYVTRGETLAQLATQWKVPAELIYNVNRSVIENPQTIPAGTELKMIQGPFHAEINAKERVMTLFVNEMYAVRFGVRIGISGNPRAGRFGVMMKSAEGMNWMDADENVYPPSSPLNGYGKYFLGLEGELCIHAVGEDKTDGHYGCFGFLAQDAKDVFEILTTDSIVTVK